MPEDRILRPEVVELVRGMNHENSNIAAVHYDGPVLEEMLAVYRDWLKARPTLVRG